jgi:ribonuclease VapC
VIVDTSAILAILFAGPDAERYFRAISDALVCRMSVATFVESSIVVESQTGDNGSRQWDQFFRRAGFILEPVTEEQAYAARHAWSNFGKGRCTAKLNFGDCFSYALAKTLGGPLLFKGPDFSQTDVSPAIWVD